MESIKYGIHLYRQKTQQQLISSSMFNKISMKDAFSSYTVSSNLYYAISTLVKPISAKPAILPVFIEFTSTPPIFRIYKHPKPGICSQRCKQNLKKEHFLKYKKSIFFASYSILRQVVLSTKLKNIGFFAPCSSIVMIVN